MSERVPIAIGLVVLAAWCAAIATGLGRIVLGASPTVAAEVALYLPGIAIGAALILFGAVRRMSLHAPRWVPTEPVPEPVVEVPVPVVEPHVRVRRPQQAEREVLAIVHLGPAADPAWAAWGLRWEAPGLGAGLVPLPSGARVIVGRDPTADIVARLDQVSWQHLELDVQEGRVIVFELGSSNGTRHGETVVPERAPWPWAPGETLSLAHPVALTLTLEPLR